jgi:hypothetical protein
MTQTRGEIGSGSAPRAGAPEAWSAQRFFALLGELGRLRIISISGPSTFESICEVGSAGFGGGFMNAITEQYHWHLELRRFGHLRSRDDTHARSGRRVLFFELRESAESPPFLRIYLHREKGEEFDPQRERRFAEVHEQLRDGTALEIAQREARA